LKLADRDHSYLIVMYTTFIYIYQELHSKRIKKIPWKGQKKHN